MDSRNMKKHHGWFYLRDISQNTGLLGPRGRE